MSHTYDFAQFEKVIEQIRQRYLTAMDELHIFLLQETLKDD